MDLIYTDSHGKDIGVIKDFSLDMEVGEKVNDFELIVNKKECSLSSGSFIYLDGAPYGGVIDGFKIRTKEETITYYGRVFQGIFDSKVIEPQKGEDYYLINGDSLESAINKLIESLKFEEVFILSKKSDESILNTVIKNFKFDRYCKGYQGLLSLLKFVKAKVKFLFSDGKIELLIEKAVNHSNEDEETEDRASFEVQKVSQKPNHLMCLGKGELKDREVIHLYLGGDGRLTEVQYFKGKKEFVEIYENTSSEDLRSDGIKHFEKLLNSDKITLLLNQEYSYDIGDTVGARDNITGLFVKKTISSKILKIENSTINIEYK